MRWDWFCWIILRRNSLITYDPSEYPQIFTNLFGNKRMIIYASILPVIWATSNAGLNGLSVYFLRISSSILAAPNTSETDFKKNLNNPLMVVLSQTKAYISESCIWSVMSAHSSNLSVSSDRKPLMSICTTLHCVVVFALFKF